MSAFLTFGEAKMRFQGLVTTGVTVEEAIQELVDRAYEMGRFPEMTDEVLLTSSDYVLNDDPDEVYVDLDPDTYDGAIGFRTDTRGFQIMDQVSLFKEIQSGNDCFIDLGIVTVSGSEKRRYRMPRGFTSAPNEDYYALLKRRPPQLANDDDTIPLRPIGALKVGVLAIGYENVNDVERAQYYWKKFEELMIADEKQFHGVKRRHIGFDANTKRRPTNFM